MSVGNNLPFLGWQSAICIAKQTTNTTFVTSGAFIEFNSESLKQEREEIKLMSINGTRDIRRRLVGNESISGGIECDLNANNDGIINIIKQAMGGTVSSAAHASSAAAYTHTIRTGDMENNADSAGSADMKGLSIGVRKGNINTWQISNCRVNQLAIKGEVGSPVIITADIIGQTNTMHTSIGAAAIAFNNDLPVNFVGVTIKTGVSIGAALTTEYFTGFELSINNNLDGDQRALGSRNIIGSYPGKQEVTCKLTQRFDTLTAFNRFIQNTMTAVEITLDNGMTLTGGSVTNSLVIKLPACYWNTTMPEVGEPGVLTFETEVAAIMDTTSSYTVQMTLVNGTASYS